MFDSDFENRAFVYKQVSGARELETSFNFLPTLVAVGKQRRASSNGAAPKWKNLINCGV